jgi:hypothetical protein
MTDALKKLDLPAEPRDRLPLGYGEIMVGGKVMDEAVQAARTLRLPKYRHAQLFTPRPHTPLSKLEL